MPDKASQAFSECLLFEYYFLEMYEPLHHTDSEILELGELYRSYAIKQTGKEGCGLLHAKPHGNHLT